MYWCFWTVVLEKTLESPLGCKEIQQVHPKEINTESSLEGLMLKLKLQYFGHLMRRTDSLEKTLLLGKAEGGRRKVNRGWDGWMASPTQWTWVWVNSGSWWWTGRHGMLQSMGSQRVRHDWVTELNWTEHVRPKLPNYPFHESLPHLLPPSNHKFILWGLSTFTAVGPEFNPWSGK